MAWSGEFDGFDWDEGNSDKSRRKHGVTIEECEQVFSNIPLLFLDDLKHSKFEERFIAMGKTDAGKMLFVVFTPRQSKVRVISARPMTGRNARFMKKALKKIPKFRSEEEEAEFWLSHGSSEYVDWSKAKVLRAPLVKRRSDVTLPISLPKSAYNRLRELARDRDVPYTLLARQIFREGLRNEIKG